MNIKLNPSVKLQKINKWIQYSKYFTNSQQTLLIRLILKNNSLDKGDPWLGILEATTFFGTKHVPYHTEIHAIPEIIQMLYYIKYPVCRLLGSY